MPSNAVPATSRTEPAVWTPLSVPLAVTLPEESTLSNAASVPLPSCVPNVSDASGLLPTTSAGMPEAGVAPARISTRPLVLATRPALAPRRSHGDAVGGRADRTEATDGGVEPHEADEHAPRAVARAVGGPGHRLIGVGVAWPSELHLDDLLDATRARPAGAPTGRARRGDGGVEASNEHRVPDGDGLAGREAGVGVVAEEPIRRHGLVRAEHELAARAVDRVARRQRHVHVRLAAGGVASFRTQLETRRDTRRVEVARVSSVAVTSGLLEGAQVGGREDGAVVELRPGRHAGAPGVSLSIRSRRCVICSSSWAMRSSGATVAAALVAHHRDAEALLRRFDELIAQCLHQPAQHRHLLRRTHQEQPLCRLVAEQVDLALADDLPSRLRPLTAFVIGAAASFEQRAERLDDGEPVREVAGTVDPVAFERAHLHDLAPIDLHPCDRHARVGARTARRVGVLAQAMREDRDVRPCEVRHLAVGLLVEDVELQRRERVGTRRILIGPGRRTP